MAVPSNATYSNGSGVISGDQLDTFVQGGALVANLRVFTGLSNMTVATIGTSTAGDGGGGEFYWNSTSTATDDGVTVVRPYGLTVGAWLRVPQQISGGYISNVAITGSSFGTGTISNTAISNSAISGGTISNATILNVSYAGNLSVAGTVAMGSSFVRNKLINGGMAIDQRNAGASQTITAGAALAYTVDRWYAYCTGANVTGQRVSASAPNQYIYQITGAPGNTAVGFGQRIETANSYDLAGTTSTLSVALAASSITTVNWTASYANSTDTFGTIASPTVTQIATGTFTVSSVLTTYNTQISIPSAAITGLQIVFTTAALTGTLSIGNAQLEPGSAATPFERLGISQVLSKCQRYFETTYNGVAIGTSGQTSNGDYEFVSLNSSDSYAAGYFVYSVLKRVAPTIAVYNPSTGAGGLFWDYTSSATNGTLQSINITPRSFQCFNVSSSWTAAHQIGIHLTISAEL